VADPARAPAMQAYMKSAVPYRGVSAVPLRKACRLVFEELPLTDARAWREAVLFLWRSATHREDRYAAIELSGHRRYRQWQSLEMLPVYEEMVITGAWWDYVDTVAIHRIGEPLLLGHPELAETMREWARHTDLWKRRAAIICQVAFKTDTDLALLYDCIAPNLPDRQFFIRKAIGWALRSYAWTDPGEVVRYVDSVGNRMSPLSRREALKNVRLTAQDRGAGLGGMKRMKGG
jgi:3-methyladenine DNA glycosylase AlkD